MSSQAKGEAKEGSVTRHGLDTNVLLRYLVADDPVQHEAATHLIEHECSVDQPGLIHPVALCEVVWALRQVYKVPKVEIVHALKVMLRIKTLHVLNASTVARALSQYEAMNVDFADAFLHAAYRNEGGGLATFDRCAARLPGAQAV